MKTKIKPTHVLIDQVIYPIEKRERLEEKAYRIEQNQPEKIEDIDTLFHDLQSAYGRCKSKLYLDTVDGQTKTIGWVFEKKERYYDNWNKFYILESWVSLLSINRVNI